MQCALRSSEVSGAVAAIAVGATAIAAGAEILPYDRVYGRFGIGGRNTRTRGNTSVISAVVRRFVGFGDLGRQPSLEQIFRSNSRGAAGRLAARISVLGGAALEVYAAHELWTAYDACSQ